ncbi:MULTISPECIES: ATP-binding protein [unclassified Streptomyces]|uniref:ATP-binding protein n=1 Tax=unclassified Streptomyces TaxID=2593676 RepID=UPI000DAEC45F|nr:MULTISPECIES: ATP-binding protein [unclassified Streptomyces]PZT73490.1 ATP-binding protein [Streptomyces sp. AC1-42T]PZT83517.1 ATP-binding protein [Streptomyces sp. AC1-42W]
MTVPLDRHYLVELQVSAERVGRLRRIVAAHLRHWSLELHVRPVCRAVEELLTNVHRHVGDDNRCVVELRWSGRHLTVSVADNGSGMPRLLREGGGGLSRVMALSDSWGTCRTADGKVVWFTRYAQEPQHIGLVPLPPLPGVREFRRPPVVAAEIPEPVPAAVEESVPDAAPTPALV